MQKNNWAKTLLFLAPPCMSLRVVALKSTRNISTATQSGSDRNNAPKFNYRNPHRKPMKNMSGLSTPQRTIRASRRSPCAPLCI